MRAFVALRGWSRRFGVLAGFALAAAGSAASAESVLTVHLDQATIIKLPERAATLVVGNPLIADATVQQPGNIVVITGKGYGATNLVALDRAGAVLTEQAILVLAARDPIVVVYRGVLRESYSCTPTCEPRVNLGDGNQHFVNTLTQVTTLSSQAQGQGGGQK